MTNHYFINKACRFLLLAIVFTSCKFSHTYGQTIPLRDTVLPLLTPVNAGFDVIIKKNGDFVYGLVKEVGQFVITYKRTDIPDGPLYSIPRVEVYAISYRNQVKDVLSPVNNPVVPAHSLLNRRGVNYKRVSFFQQPDVRIGLGFIRSYSKVKDANNYSSSATFPVVSVAYDILFQSNLRLGAQVALGTHKFSNQAYSSYDSTQTSISLKENIFTLFVYGKYLFLNSSAVLRPYIIGGLGINSSHVTSNSTINFLSNSSEVILVKSGARAVGLGVMARVGADYYFNDRLAAFADAGVGASVINIGVSIGLY